MVRNDSKHLHTDGDFYRKLGEILVGIKKSTKTFLVYAENHPARAQALGHTHKQITELLAQRAPLSFQIRREGFFCDEVAVGGDHPFLRDFAPVLALRGIQAIRLLHGVRFEDVQHLTELLILEAEDLSQQGGGRAFLEVRGTTAIEVEGFDMEFVETGFAQPGSAIQGENPAPEPLQPTAPSAPAEPIEEPAAGETEEEEARPDLDTLILELQKTDRPARYENITQELSQLGRDALARGDSDPCLRIMTALALELHPNNSKDETITRYARWTLRSLLEETGPALVIEAFCRGAMVPEDDLVHLLLTAKEEMAEAVGCSASGRAFLEARGTTAIEVEGFDMEFVETRPPRTPPRSIPLAPVRQGAVRRPPSPQGGTGAGSLSDTPGTLDPSGGRRGPHRHLVNMLFTRP